MAKYAGVGREVRALMRDLTPLVEPVSIDEAFIDLTGTARLHGMSPAKSLAGFADRGRARARHHRVDRALRATSSSPRSPPISTSRAASRCSAAPRRRAFLAPRPVTLIWGVGKVAQPRLARDGLRTIGDLQRAGETELMRRYGAEGARLARLARGATTAAVTADRETKSVSAETTFDQDIADFRPLELRLWRLSEKVSGRLKANELAGSTVTLKLKTADFRIRTRAQFARSSRPSSPRKIFAAGRELLARETDGTKFRLIGIGVSALCRRRWRRPRRSPRPPHRRGRTRHRPPARTLRRRSRGQGLGVRRG